MKARAYAVKGSKPHFCLAVDQTDEAEVFVAADPGLSTLSVVGWGARERVIEIIKSLQEVIGEAS